MNTYQQAVLKARKQFLKLNKKQEKELLNLYTELAKQLENDICKCRTTSKELYLKKLHNIVVANIRDMHGDLKKIVTDNIITSSEIASSVDYAYYESITNNAGLLATFNNMVLNTREQTVKKLIQGKFYKDNTSLSERLWNLENKNIKSIDIAIKTNILRGANARELAKNIEKYVNPNKRLDIKTDAVGFNQNISYNASRLARTSISHSFRETQIQQAMNNPLNIGVKWELSPSHSMRMHGKRDICDEYANQNNYGLGIGVFPAKDLPLGHCNCLCNTYEVNTPINKAVQRLKAWSEGEEDKELDKWYEKNNKNNDKKTNKEYNNNRIRNEGLNDKKKYAPIQSIVNWQNIININQKDSEILNSIHSELNKFMVTERREKIVLYNKNNMNSNSQEGEKIDEVKVSKDIKNVLKKSELNSIIFVHNHPSPTTFSRYDINYIIQYKSIYTMTLECIDGSKYVLERGAAKSSIINKINFPAKYDSIYWKVAEKYPELDDEIKKYEVWDKFLNEVTEEVAQEYGMIYKKVNNS